MKKVYCSNCGYEGRPKKVTRGSILIELVLWLFFLVPGLIYSIWRLTTRHAVCTRCGFGHVYQRDGAEPLPPARPRR